MSELSENLPPELSLECEYLGEAYQDTWLHDLWEVTLVTPTGRMTTQYRSDVGHRREGLAVDPDLADVLHCLLSDGDACHYSFEEWCDSYGYDTDSRAAERTYLACVATGEKLSSLGLDLETLSTLEH